MKLINDNIIIPPPKKEKINEYLKVFGIRLYIILPNQGHTLLTDRACLY